jgi:hypothetical protein
MKVQSTGKFNKVLLAFSIGLIGLGFGATAQAENSSELDSHYEAASHSEDSHHHASNVVGLFVGGTTTDESTEFSIGLEYEHHINQYFGVGVILEHTPDSVHFTDGATIALAAFHAHPWRGLRLTTAVGAEVGHGDLAHHGGSTTQHAEKPSHGVVNGHDVPDTHAPTSHSSHGKASLSGHKKAEEAGSDVLVRLGVAYDFEVAESMAIAPTVNVDFVNGEENLVFGMTFSYHF